MDARIVTIVSGLPRSGTSLMMQMLEAGGLEILTDKIRQSDDDNPRGYYELEAIKRLEKDQSCLANAEGKAVKIISELLKYLPPTYTYKIIFMHRSMQEVLASQKQMLIRRGKPAEDVPNEKLPLFFQRHLERVEAWLKQQSHMNVLDIHYSGLMEHPAEPIEKINRFLGNSLNVTAMASVIDRTLYRQRRRPRVGEAI
jgi:hypothetical protein